MNYTYCYRDRGNSVHCGSVRAASRDDVFKKLKKVGIKPYDVSLAPGFLNRLMSIGKRWLAILILSVVSAVFAVSYFGTSRSATEQTYLQQLPRHQVAGLPTNWEGALVKYIPSRADAYFALFAQPGMPIEGLSGRSSIALLSKFDDDLEAMPVINENAPGWVKEISLIVAGMKAEALALRKAGKTDRDISLWLVERQRMELSYRDMIKGQVRSKDIEVEEANRMLSAMNLRLLEN